MLRIGMYGCVKAAIQRYCHSNLLPYLFVHYLYTQMGVGGGAQNKIVFKVTY